MQKDIINAVIIFIVVVAAGTGLMYASSLNGTTSATPTPAQTNTAQNQPQQSDDQLRKQLKITDEVVGSGPAVKNGDTVNVTYIGTLPNGTIFDQTKEGQPPFSFTVGQGQVIKGWDLGLIGMQAGGKRKIVIPPALGYGNQANGSIPANSTLIFEIQLQSIK